MNLNKKQLRPATKADLPSITELNNLVQSLHADNHPKLIKAPLEGAEFSDRFVDEKSESIVLVVSDAER